LVVHGDHPVVEVVEDGPGGRARLRPRQLSRKHAHNAGLTMLASLKRDQIRGERFKLLARDLHGGHERASPHGGRGLPPPVEIFRAGMCAPRSRVAGPSTRVWRFSRVFRAAPAPMVQRDMRCVKSGPNTPLAGVPRTVWQLMQASEAKSSRPRFAVASSRASVRWAATQRSNSSFGCTTTTRSMRPCWMPQYSAHWPT